MVTLRVPVRQLDTVFPTDTRVDFIKVDVEGAEAALFRGGLETLRRSRPVVVFECHPETLQSVADILHGAAYEIGFLDDFLAGGSRPPKVVAELAIEEAHWYFTATPRD